MLMGSIDLIVPCYRYGKYLEECIDSILSQTGPAIRVLIIDDASPDDSAEIARRVAQRDRRIALVVHERNRGPTATFNEGLDWASADYLLTISADDYLTAGALARAVDLLDAHPEASFAFGRGMRLRNGVLTGNDALAEGIARLVGPGESRVISGREFMERSGAYNIVHAVTAVVRTQLQKRVGGYRHELKHTHDMEMWLRLAAHGPVGVIKPFQGVYRHHGDNISERFYAQSGVADVHERKAAFDTLFDNHGHLIEDAQSLRRQLMAALAGDAVRRARGAYNEGNQEAYRELTGLALALCPAIKHSSEWAMLIAQRAVGRSVWRSSKGLAKRIFGSRSMPL
jgi:GT2 family glycosyltransferase